jgi:alpha-galactosidase
MITTENGRVVLETAHTAYCFCVTEEGLLEHLYYGPRLPRQEDYDRLGPELRHAPGGSPVLAGGVCPDALAQEAGTSGWGDLRPPLVRLRFDDGGESAAFRFVSLDRPEQAAPDGLPAAAEGTEHLRVVCREAHHPVVLELYYTVFPDTDVIVRWSRLINQGQRTVAVGQLGSTQVDLPAGDYELLTFRGAWAREMDLTRQAVRGEVRWGSRAGISSSQCNPFAMVCRAGAGEDHGEVWAFNLIYSGDHSGCAAAGPYGGVRVVQGMGDTVWQLLPGARFDSPQAVMTWSGEGFGGISRRMHPFVRRHIVRGRWRDRDRPVLVNSWEALYFKVSRQELLSLGRQARDIGAELLVVDDGWFTGRSDDTRALGDWTEDTKKLPGGLRELSRALARMDLALGLWVEPEMVSEDSELYRAHPDWILGRKEQAIGRNQYVLDLSRPEVCDHIYESMERLLRGGEVRYIKWDMNRILTDTFSPAWPPQRQGEVRHRYMLGLYGVLGRLTEAFPEVLFESCASGGARADLGMLCYMPQLWASDNTDAACRTAIQSGYSYGYPQSVLGCHVSACPNHQTLRTTPLHSRFHVAALGLLGYEMDLRGLSSGEKQQIRDQVTFYKAHRHLFQFGQLYRLPREGEDTFTMVVSEDGREAMGVHFVPRNTPNQGMTLLRTAGLEDERLYRLSVRPVPVRLAAFGSLVNMISPVRMREGSLVHHVANRMVRLSSEREDLTASGARFNHAGFWPVQAFSGTGYSEGLRVMGDWDSRLYHWRAAGEDAPAGTPEVPETPRD